jgi:dihydrofolate reductase
MRKLKLEMMVSADGFAADEHGAIDWMVWSWGGDWSWDKKLRQYHIDMVTSSDCILLSRKMAEEGFHDHWRTVAENPADPQAAFAMPATDMRKVVFSKTLDRSQWPNTELAKGDIAEEVNRLKRSVGKDIIVYGGPTLASSLASAGLIDEYHFFLNPTLVGRGRPMFKDLAGNVGLVLAGCTAFDCGVTVIQYLSKT